MTRIFRVHKKDGLPSYKIMAWAIKCWQYFPEVRITVEPVREQLPESKPEKNCGNCANVNALDRTACNNCVSSEYNNWQPKAAEPKSKTPEWMYCLANMMCQSCGKECESTIEDVNGCLKALTLYRIIRAEIDKSWGDGFKAGFDIAEEKRSEK